MHPVHSLPPYFLKIHSNIILLSTSRLGRDSNRN
jgi:hypothetical protein